MLAPLNCDLQMNLRRRKNNAFTLLLFLVWFSYAKMCHFRKRNIKREWCNFLHARRHQHCFAYLPWMRRFCWTNQSDWTYALTHGQPTINPMYLFVELHNIQHRIRLKGCYYICYTLCNGISTWIQIFWGHWWTSLLITRNHIWK